MFITRGSQNAEHMSAAIGELNTQTDRAVAIIGGSLVEISLTEAITAHLHRNERVTDELFRPSGALGAFAPKIHLGMLIGIYGHAAHREMLIVKDIRNQFAHSLEIRDFKSEKIKAWTKNLNFGERYTIDNASQPPRHSASIKDKPIGEWPWWFGVTDRDAALADPRERYLLTVQALCYGLCMPDKTAMPSPHF
jgi:hypothetical protein